MVAAGPCRAVQPNDELPNFKGGRDFRQNMYRDKHTIIFIFDENRITGVSIDEFWNDEK